MPVEPLLASTCYCADGPSTPRFETTDDLLATETVRQDAGAGPRPGIPLRWLVLDNLGQPSGSDALGMLVAVADTAITLASGDGHRK